MLPLVCLWLGAITAEIGAGPLFEGGPIEQRFSAPARPELVIEGGFFSVEIVGYEGDEVAGRAVMSSRAQERNQVSIRLDQEPARLVLRVVTNERDVLASSMSWYPVIALRVPHAVSVSVTAAGNIILEDLRAPRVDLYTFSGDIVAKAVVGDLWTTNATGLTRVSSSAGGKWLLSSNGDFVVEHSSGDLWLQSITGTVTLRDVSGQVTTNIEAERLNLSGLSGSVSFQEKPVTGVQQSAN